MSDPVAPAQAAPEKALLDAHLRMLGRLAEAGLEIAMALERRAKAAEPEEGAGDPSIDLDAVALAYSRVSRAVRMCILLQSRLIHGPDKAGKPAKDPCGDRDKLKADALAVMQAVAEAETEHGEGERAERLMTECAERLDAEPWDSLLQRPFEDILAEICKDLGVDWPLYRTHPWVHHVLQELNPAGFWEEGRYRLIWADSHGKPMFADDFEGAAEWARRLAAGRGASTASPEPADSG